MKTKKQNKTQSKKISFGRIFLYGLGIILVLFLLFWILPSFSDVKYIPVTQVVEDVKAGKVTKIEVSDTYLIVKEGSHTYRTFKEPSSNLYQLFKDAGVSLDKTNVTVKDDTGIATLVNLIASVLPVVGIVVAMVFMGVFYVTIIYIIYLVIRALKKYLSS